MSSEEAFGIGRHPDNGGCLDDEGISRFHCRISQLGTLFGIEDLGSSNGTYVNGKRVERCTIRNGDTVQLGPRVSFRFSVATADEERVLTQLYESSVRDPLTRAFNRQYFNNRIKSEIAFAIRHETDLALALLDIDFFKKINDNYGHLTGDEVLKGVTATLGEALRTEDVLVRYGGEEFVVLLRGIPLDKAGRAAERLRRAVERHPIQHDERLVSVTISLGVSTLECCAEANPEELIAIADRRLYAAKEAGRNRVVATDEPPSKNA
jgi:diguanylate cyclase (GGDEF)-like protein